MIARDEHARRAAHVLRSLAHGDADEGAAALIAAQRDGYRFRFVPSDDGTRVFLTGVPT